MTKTLPFNQATLEQIISKYPTPFHLYDEAGIRSTAKVLNEAYNWSNGYLNYFALKANPNPYVIDILKTEGMGADTSSLPELILAKAVGLMSEKVMFTANNVAAEEYQQAFEQGAIINLDDISQIDVLEEVLGGKLPELICFRYNPGPDIVTSSDNVIGNPADAKYGLTTEQLPKAYKLAKQKGAKRFGLHTMLVSNQCNEQVHVQTAKLLFEMAVQLNKEVGIRLEFINLGGGLGVAYNPADHPLNLVALKQGLTSAYQKIIVGNKLDPIKVVTENGRFVLAPNGYLVTKVRSIKQTYHTFVGVDATMADLMRPGMYDAYHHISVPGKANQPLKPQRVTGSLCENNDIFTGTNDRMLPELEIGDILVIHDTGAHGYSLGFNYNGKLRHAELLVKTDGSIQQIRRPETLNDYFITLNYPGLTQD